jgi:hypothetical protein
VRVRHHVHGAAYVLEVLSHEMQEIGEDGEVVRELPSAKLSTPKQVGAVVEALVAQAAVSEIQFTRHGCWVHVAVPDDPEISLREHLDELRRVVAEAWEAAK